MELLKNIINLLINIALINLVNDSIINKVYLIINIQRLKVIKIFGRVRQLLLRVKLYDSIIPKLLLDNLCIFLVQQLNP